MGSRRILVIGGGFFGVVVARHLATQRPRTVVVLAERGARLLSRASYNNQARVHNGYHYPRSLTTAFRSRVNFPRFLRDFDFAIYTNFTKLYAIARENSRLTAKQFERVCKTIGAKLEQAPNSVASLFEPRLIEQVYLAEEWAFDADKLAAWGEDELIKAGVEIHLETRVASVISNGSSSMIAQLESASNLHERGFDQIFNCTYSGLSGIKTPGQTLRAALKYELTEMALLEPPAALDGLGITVMDGPFFSFMPFPAKGLYTLSHVRYTPHAAISTIPLLDPNQWTPSSRVDNMLRDAERYLPALADARHRDSLFEIKTLLQKSEFDDGRPILFERHSNLPCFISILGGKIDNVYDILEKLDTEDI